MSPTGSEPIPNAVGTWRLSFHTNRGQEHPVVALGADRTGVYQSPEGPLPVAATFDGNDVFFIATHKTVMTNFKMRFRGTVSGDNFDGGMVAVAGQHPASGVRSG